MELRKQSFKEYFRILVVIHLFLVLGIVLFGLVVSFLIADFKHSDNDSELAQLFIYLVPGLIIAGILGSGFVYKIKLNLLSECSDLQSRMTAYREATIVRYALLQAPALFALLAIFITNNINYLVYAGLMVVLMLIKRPTMKAAIAEMNLDQQDLADMEDPD